MKIGLKLGYLILINYNSEMFIYVFTFYVKSIDPWIYSHRKLYLIAENKGGVDKCSSRACAIASDTATMLLVRVTQATRTSKRGGSRKL